MVIFFFFFSLSFLKYLNQVINWKLDHIGMNPTAEAYLVLHRFGNVSMPCRPNPKDFDKPLKYRKKKKENKKKEEQILNCPKTFK